MDINNAFGSRENRLAILNFLRFIPDKTMLKIEYRLKLKKRLRLNPPITFNEKLQWLKLYDRKPEYTIMADKYAVREYIKDKIGERYLVPIYGVWDDAHDIDFDKLPNEFVLKCTHDSGSVTICRDKRSLDKNNTIQKFSKMLKRNSYIAGREWPYKNIKPRVIAEMLLKEKNYEYLPVYKIFCFNGDPKIIQQLQNDKQENETVDYFDINWNRLNMKQRFPNSEVPLPRPQTLDEMLEIAKKLSKGIPFVRIDLYEVNGKILFSEHTFYTDAGYSIFEPEEENWDERLGEYIDLRNIG